MKQQYWQKQPPVMFNKKRVLTNFAKDTRKHLCQSIFFDKVAGLSPAILLTKRLQHKCFPVNFAKFVGKSFLKNTQCEQLWWLLLYWQATMSTYSPIFLSASIPLTKNPSDSIFCMNFLHTLIFTNFLLDIYYILYVPFKN